MGTRLTIFAGAGASKAVNSNEFPTTVEFFERLPAEIQNDSFFQFAISFIRETENPDQIDIEMVLWILENLRNDCVRLQSKGSITGRFFRSSLINEIIPRKNIGAFFDLNSGARSRLDSLISSINEVVYDLYGYEPSEEELKDNWLELLHHAEGAGESLEIFTTNYDAAIETALDIRLGPDTAKEWRGVSGRIRQKLNLKEWAEIGARNSTLTKLHGSLDWRRAGKEIHVGDSNFTGNHKNHAIIYPGFKGKSDNEFFSIFHNYLAKSIAESSAIIFIGFAFRDDHINSIIRENVTSSTDVYIINPNPTNFPSQRGRVKLIQSGFNKSAISSIKF